MSRQVRQMGKWTQADYDAYNNTVYWLNKYLKGPKINNAKKPQRQLSDKQKADRKRYFITQANKAKKEGIKFGIPSKKDHESFFKNHQGAGKKATQKTKHLDPTPDSDPDEGPAPKVPKTDLGGGYTADDLEAAMDPRNDVEMAAADSSADAAVPMSDSPSGGGGGGGGGGIGESTGNWTCETIWGSNSIITNASRHCVCLTRDFDKYTAIGNNSFTDRYDNENATPWVGWSTPWNYIDFNQMCIHFSPRDWQRLINGASRWRPKSVHVRIFNIQVIQKTTTADGVQYSNDLTGTIQIFADSAGRYPRLMYPCQTTMMGPFPNQVYYLPQYAYTTACDGPQSNQQINALLNQYSAFYCLDESASAMLRTGNEWSCHYTFGADTDWVLNRRSTIPINERVNPLYDTWQVNLRGDDAKRGHFASWRQPWLPGPSISITDSTASDAALSVSSGVAIGPSYMGIVPGPPMCRGESSKDEYLQTFWIPKNVGMNEGDVKNAQISPSTAYKKQVPTGRLWEVNPRGLYRVGGNQGASEDNKWSGCVPGMIWDRRPATYFDPIWQEKPETDDSFMYVSQMGGCAVSGAPGHIFVKNTPKPTGAQSTYVDEYSTFTITVTMEWEYVPHTYSQWNSYKTVSNTEAQAQAYLGMVNASGVYVTGMDGDNPVELHVTKNLPRVN
ncbi:minor capsid protein [Red-crowned crane parvovirus]|uniref:Minor capsid protein n=2 Tax=Red-crowned crane parvovirus TaxID=2079601 RepID=A0A2K9YNA0_9VIRU|nr:minor capsid protein [Red-crowned crane parvovirus]AUW34313.1 minor capsid protein [Red-crowned crane parvovirus]